MNFQLPNPDFSPNFKLRHTDKLFLIGSCFADTMSRYFAQRKFVTMQNPFGVLYNPVSIANSIEHIANQQHYNQAEFYSHDGLFSSWHHHSNLSEASANVLKSKLEKINALSHSFLQNADVVFITLGTAWVQWHKKSNIIVANNLKAPADIFEQRILSIEEIETALHELINSLRVIKSNVKIVFTLSPVRHSKQGLIENNLSKARLLEGIHAVCHQDVALTYLPAYEIIIDVLRDYRFFDKDLVHPNELATDYIWEYIVKNFIAQEELPAIENSYKLHLAVQHKLRHPTSKQALKFKNEQLQKIAMLEKEYSYLDLSLEREYFKNL